MGTNIAGRRESHCWLDCLAFQGRGPFTLAFVDWFGNLRLSALYLIAFIRPEGPFSFRSFLYRVQSEFDYRRRILPRESEPSGVKSKRLRAVVGSNLALRFGI